MTDELKPLKICNLCRVEKEVSEFYPRRLRRNGTIPVCKDCSSKKAKQRYSQKKTHINKINAQWKDENREKNRETNKQYKINNSVKVKECSNKYYLKNRINISLRNREWYANNRGKRTKKINEWKMNNPELSKLYRLRSGAKIRSTVTGKLNNTMSGSIWKALRGKKNGERWEFLVGYTVEELKKRMESNFSMGMNWDNYGSFWEIDHIIPKSVFNYVCAEDLDFKRAWGLNNLQPLLTLENRKKYNKTTKPFQPSLLIKGVVNG